MRAPSYSRPGTPDPWWHPFAFLAVVMAAGALAWALLAGGVWLVWVARAYLLVVGSILVALAGVAGCVWLMQRPDWRARIAGAALFGALVALIIWAAPV